MKRENENTSLLFDEQATAQKHIPYVSNIQAPVSAPAPVPR